MVADTNLPEELRLPIAEFMSLYPNYKIIYLHVSGSKLYGTNTPDSDTDYRGIYIPSEESLLLKNDVDHWKYGTSDKKEKNKAGDVDFEMWSIHKFIGMLRGGDTNAFDTLFSSGTKCDVYNAHQWRTMYHGWYRFKPTSIKSFFGYALGQVKKYSVKGDKLQDVTAAKKSTELFMDIITRRWNELKDSTNLDPDKATISEMVSTLPITENLKWVSDDTNEYYQVLDKKFIKTIRITEFLKRLNEIETKYGARAKDAMDNGNIDYKAMYHAFRVLDECKQLMSTECIEFPLHNADFLLKVRSQHYKPQEMFEMLESQYDEVSELEKTDGNILTRTSSVTDEHRNLFMLQLLKSVND